MNGKISLIIVFLVFFISMSITAFAEESEMYKTKDFFLDTQKEGNDKAIEFFKKNGFKEAGIIKDYYYTLKCKDALILSLDLKWTR